MALLALPFPRRFCTEAFLITHQLLAIAVVYCLWRYTELASLTRAFLIVSIVVYGAGFVARQVQLLYRNYCFQKGWSRCAVRLSAPDLFVVEIQVVLARPLKVRCGQYVLLWVPKLGVWSSFQRQPVPIAWWVEDERGRATHLSFLVKPQSTSMFKLATLANPALQDSQHVVVIDGPYGKAIDTNEYGTLLLFASGLGIGGVMSFMNEAIIQRPKWLSLVRQIELIWQIDHPRKLPPDC